MGRTRPIWTPTPLKRPAQPPFNRLRNSPGSVVSEIDSLFTKESLESLQGATAAALFVPNALGALIPPLARSDLWRRWVSFAIAMAISLTLAFTRDHVDVGVIAIGALNGFLVFASAVGINQVAEDRARRPRGPALSPYEEFGARKQSFWSRFWVNWFPATP